MNLHPQDFLLFADLVPYHAVGRMPGGETADAPRGGISPDEPAGRRDRQVCPQRQAIKKRLHECSRSFREEP
ncbi:MAG: hypothetical protein JNM12_12690 [Alphaproteobacteria bacterium]|nr:hypothetical protein [Alphaproteobacteria bacterium]